jgi:hypothetical protein
MSTVQMCDSCGDTRQRNDFELGDWFTISVGAGPEVSKTREFCTEACAHAGLSGLAMEHVLASIEAVEEANEAEDRDE